jgi:NADH-quinone oxidoreductase subunit C
MSVGDVLVAALGSDCATSQSFTDITVDVPPARWVEAISAARDLLACHYFDWLTAVDELAEGYSIVCHLWSVEHRYGLLVRTRVPLGDARLASLTGLFAGAGWHERETYEMFGVTFDGHPNLLPLLLPDGFEGHPLRKEFVLASRVAKEWPGAREPGESSAGGPVRRRMRPPGVPDPADWGPEAVRDAPEAPAAPEAASEPAPRRRRGRHALPDDDDDDASGAAP